MTKTSVNDALSDFTREMVAQAGFGGNAGYRDSPLSGYSKDGFAGAGGWYATSWIARAAVDTIPEDCFKRGYQWVGESDQIGAIEAVERRHDVQRKKRMALSLSRLDGEAYIYFDVGSDPSKPLNVDGVGRGALRFVNVLRRQDVRKGPIDSDPISEFFGQPEYYEVNGKASAVRIHPSRVIRFANSPDPETGEGVPVLRYVLQPIIAAETARDNVVALTTEANIDIISVCNLADSVDDPRDAANVARRYGYLRSMKATNRLVLLDKDGEEWSQRQVSFANLPEVIETMRREAAAAIGIPYSLLFGRPGGLGTNGEAEIQTYYDNIATMQRNDIQPVCEPLDEVVVRSALGSKPDEVYLDWLSLWEMSDQEKATVAKTVADAAGVAVDKGIIPADVLTESLINSWVEIGAFQGIDQSYDDWKTGGGVLDDPADESDVVDRDEE